MEKGSCTPAGLPENSVTDLAATICARFLCIGGGEICVYKPRWFDSPASLLVGMRCASSVPQPLLLVRVRTPEVDDYSSTVVR